jgi:signal transduction histidine kinase
MHGACSARILLTEFGLAFETDDLYQRFGLGRHAQLMAALDEIVLERSNTSAEILLKGSEISQNLTFGNKTFDDFGVISVPLNWNDLCFGILWVTFENSQLIGEEEVAYIRDLGHFTSLAIMNTKTFEESTTSQTLFESVVNLLPDAVIIADQDGHIIFQNNSAVKVLGFDDVFLEGGSLSTFLVGVDLENGWEVGKKLEVKEVHLQNDKAFQLITSPISLNPHQVGQAMIFRDLTQQKIEESLKTEFVTTVSHELRSPLTLILGYAKILRLTGNLNEQQDAYISNIIDGVEEMKDLVQKLLDIGRLEGGDPLDIQQFTAEEIIQRIVECMDAQAKQKNIQIMVNLPDSPLLIEGDQTFLTQALKNLIENAVKFSKMGGDVVLRVQRNADRVVFAVQDQGIGIAPLDQRHLFKKFKRISTQGGLTQTGSGLGLAIVKSIAERHGGQVWLESQLGKGSTFYLEIPRKQS